MSNRLSTFSQWVRIARILNIRVIRTPYLKAIIYFAIAIALCLLFYFLMRWIQPAI